MVSDGLASRQIWATATRTSVAASKVTSTLSSLAQSALCTVALPSSGILRFNDTFSLILEDAIPFESPCDDAIHACTLNSGNSTVIRSHDPFYASVAPQIYALATATIISYILVILIFITPRTFYVGGPGGGANFLGVRSLVPGSGSSSVIGIGRRPILQKIAAITVAISLTIATADTFKVSEGQYNDGLMDSQQLVDKVIGSTEIRVVRVISDTFLWLAQVQTLIRLFPRHKEKVTIKWLGFALVTCDTVFSILENFVSETTLTRPRNFQDAIPALSYLFQMAISLIYASCVIYYSLSKRRFAFWHLKMKNILLVASLSLASVLIPVVFFVLDVSQPNIATWGEYIRWVGAAAASVVVWEWVERIEALERDERKDGILGREIFDGDEMLEMGSDNRSNNTSTHFRFGKRSSSDDEKKVSMMPIPYVRARIPFRRKKDAEKEAEHRKAERRKSKKPEEANANGDVVRPHQAATPISRSDTTSAASTVYAVRYQNVSSPSPVIPEEPTNIGSRQQSMQVTSMAPLADARSSTLAPSSMGEVAPSQSEHERTDQGGARNLLWQAVANPFKRKRAEPPAEVAAHVAASNVRRSPAQTYHNLRDRISAFKGPQREARNRKGRNEPSPPMPVTVIPAQPRPSRVNVQSDASRDTSRMLSITPSHDHSSTRSRRDSLPVTIIPAPVRGGRTWSPDDLNDTAPSPGPVDVPNQSAVPSNMSVAPASPDIVTARGALRIAESPGRIRDHDNASRSSHVTQRTATRFRTATIDSLNNRMSSVSPGSAAAGSSGSGSGNVQGRQSAAPTMAAPAEQRTLPLAVDQPRVDTGADENSSPT